MKKNFNKAEIKEAIKSCKYSKLLESLEDQVFLAEYEKGESVVTPFMNEKYFQVVTEGNLPIYYIRNDGTKYGLSAGGKDYLLGEMNLFIKKRNSIFVTAESKLAALTIDESAAKDLLMNNIEFLQLISQIMADKIENITNSDAAPMSLSERLINYMNYKCDRGVLKGVEKAALYLHCSSRQLLRVLHEFEKDGKNRKIGKGEYRLA